MTGAIHAAFLTLGALTMLSAWSFSTLRTDDAQTLSRGGLGKA